jgi:hypothetical protein
MVELAEAKKRQRSTTNIHVLYHRYKHNLADDAFMLPLEKILAYVNDDPTEATLTAQDHQLIDNLALPLREAIASAEKHREAACSLRDAQMTMDFEGNVQLCCGTYDSRKFTIGKYRRCHCRSCRP